MPVDPPLRKLDLVISQIAVKVINEMVKWTKTYPERRARNFEFDFYFFLLLSVGKFSTLSVLRDDILEEYLADPFLRLLRQRTLQPFLSSQESILTNFLPAFYRDLLLNWQRESSVFENKYEGLKSLFFEVKKGQAVIFEGKIYREPFSERSEDRIQWIRILKRQEKK